MSDREPTLGDVLGAVNELRGDVGEVRIGLGRRCEGGWTGFDGRLVALTGEVSEQGRRLEALSGDVETLGRDTPGS